MTREDLKDYKHNQEWIKGRLEYIEEYKTSITNITSVISDMPRGSKKVQDSMAEKVVTLLNNIEELLARIIKEQERQKLILEQLDEVEQPYKLILEKEYIQGKSLVTVASEMNYTYEYIRKANGTALKKFEEVTKSYWKAHINCDNIYNEKETKYRHLVPIKSIVFLLRADVLNVCSFIYWIRTRLDISENKGPIFFLAKSIELLDKADAVVFMPGWQQARGCRIEETCAKEYGKFLMYL